MSALKGKLVSQRMKQCYVPHDALFGLCSDNTVLFLPPSRMNLGILTKTLSQKYPLEFLPCEYFCVTFEDGSFQYCRPRNGFKGFYHWTFDEEGRAELRIKSKDGIQVYFSIEVSNDNEIIIHTEIVNNSSKCIESMYINPCLRYQNQFGFKGNNHENIFINTKLGIKSVLDIAGMSNNASRILILHKDIYKTTLTKSRSILLETLMKSRFMNLSDFKKAEGETITCLNYDRSLGILFGYDSPFCFFSRSNMEESGCMHVLPLIEDFEPGEIRMLKGAILWGERSVYELQRRYFEQKRD